MDPEGARHLVPLCTALGALVTGEVDGSPRPGPLRRGTRRGVAHVVTSSREARERLCSTREPLGIHAPGLAARYRRLAELLIERGDRVVVLTGPSEADVGARLQAERPTAAHHVGQRGLREFAALLDAAARAAALVGGDSGPAHVAASVGLPVHLIAGPEDPSRTGPWPPRGGRNVVVADPSPLQPWARRSVEDVSVDDVLRWFTRRAFVSARMRSGMSL